jgi:hypothetical protein
MEGMGKGIIMGKIPTYLGYDRRSKLSRLNDGGTAQYNKRGLAGW